MIDKATVRRLFDYTVWANHRVMRMAATLTLDDFRRDLKSSHGGVRGTLVHMFSAEWIWLERFKGISPRSFPDEGEFADLMALRERWSALEEHRRSWIEELREPALQQPLAYTQLSGQAFEQPLGILVQHVVNHATYHRGQVITLLRQLGTRAVGTDYVLWDREHPPAAG